MRAAVPLPGHATASTLPPRRDVRAYSAQKVSEHSKPSTTTSAPWSRIVKIRESLLSRERSAVEIAQEHLATIERTEPILKSFIHVSDTILSEAADIDKRIANGEDIGPLAGVVVGVKDNLCTKGMPTTAASDMLRGYSPPFDATCVSKLRESGALFIGKTNMDEFGMGSSTESSAFQVTSNPWDCTRTPGGSSGGSSAAVAAHQCAVSLGSDTGGSIRQPASFCGVVGLKPTYGRVSRFGLIAYASSLDVVGCLGTSVMDTAILLEAISGQDNMDATSSRMDISSYAAKLPAINMLDSKPLKGMKVGIIQETIGDGVDREVVSCIQSSALRLEELGANIQEVSLKSFPLGLPAYYILAPSEASSNLARYDGVRYGLQVSAEDLDSMYCSSRAKGFGPEVKRRILMGTYALSAGYYDAYYKRAQQVRTLIKNDFKEALEENDFLISPAAPTPAYRKGEKVNDPLSMYAGDIMTVNVNMAGLPALVVPCGFAKNQGVDLPVGLQLIGASFDEERLLQVGHVFEQTLQNISFVPSMLGK